MLAAYGKNVMAKKRPKKIAPIQRVSKIGRIGEITGIEDLNTADSEKRKSAITDLDKELLEYNKLAFWIKKYRKTEIAATGTGAESKFEKILQSVLSGKEEVDEEIPPDRQENNDDGAHILDMEI
jgi:hypothetical protein